MCVRLLQNSTSPVAWNLWDTLCIQRYIDRIHGSLYTQGKLQYLARLSFVKPRLKKQQRQHYQYSALGLCMIDKGEGPVFYSGRKTSLWVIYYCCRGDLCDVKHIPQRLFYDSHGRLWLQVWLADKSLVKHCLF